jgi:hypothetical protein
MPTIRVSPLVDIHKDIPLWNSRDLLIYYSNKLKEFSGEHLEIPPVAWRGFMGRIKGFKDKLHLSSQDYKNFMDDVFRKLYIDKHYVPAFGAIVSERVYNLLKKDSLKQYSNEDFIALRDKLFQDKLLFKQVGGTL